MLVGMSNSSVRDLASHASHVSHTERSQNFAGTGRIAILSGILFLSGTGALIFETLWLRLSGLAFGNSIWATALILSSFMAGLALGNAIAASSRLRRWRAPRLYCLLGGAGAGTWCPDAFSFSPLRGVVRPVWQTLWNYQ